MAPAAALTYYDSGTCPYAQRAWIALLEKELPFEQIIVSLEDKPKHFTDLYASINPDKSARAKVPILIDGDTQLIESNVVVEYLDAAYRESGTRLFPADAAQLAKVRLFVELASEKLSYFKLLRADTREAVGAATQEYADGLQAVDALLRQHGSQQGGDYFLGGQYSFAEVALTPFVRRASIVPAAFRGVDWWGLVRERRLDRLEAWAKAALARPSFVKTNKQDEELTKGHAKFVAPMKD